jgi:hypothetical protein
MLWKTEMTNNVQGDYKLICVDFWNLDNKRKVESSKVCHTFKHINIFWYCQQ